MRRGFTLIELLLVVAILSTMVTVGIMGVNSSRASIGTFAAARDIMAAVRRARSVALVTQKPVAVVYSNTTSGDDVAASVEILSEKLFASKGGQPEVRNLDGEIVREAGEAATGDAEGETLAEILSPKNVPPDVLKGLRISVTKEDEGVVYRPDESKRSKISIYSTADSVVRTPSLRKTPRPRLKRASARARRSRPRPRRRRTSRRSRPCLPRTERSIRRI